MSVDLIHRLVVQRVEHLGPGMVRVVFGGEGLEGFASTGVGDEYLRIFFPDEQHREPILPRPTEAGWEYPEGVAAAPMRTYTVRAWDEVSRELSIDFVVHDGGVAAAWAVAATPGDVVGVNTPKGLYAPPAGMQWQLLVADATGLPAAVRLAENTPEGVRTRVVLEVASADDELDVALPSAVELHWVHGGNGRGPTRIEEIVRAAELPDGPGYIWVAGETKATRGVRRHLRHTLGLASTAYKVVGYWTENAEVWRERYESLPDDVRARLGAMWQDTSRDRDDIEDAYVTELEKLGL
ncbi:siderophore-interacting protein [Rhodococcus triatomae]|uniref:NADPH-dependent ferric siderophore reductase, contains FAD-binding and SIP domains n=1 Tax=Rhodococcus triatomae TaxID=300028 RepID=A0A1G8DWH0_9NOCA|nr:siderophore-interacting protein [Rhodococcus triatomae]QNG18329.1 siderophore-interacting protein [Rhodococcus triatomae]QNG22001.1 siderophore-interacting protein [Rhodococcus triatomae]SDH62024.1 NADPH-dependent ferric siderophore reductase, contains FAD-binding and SIP domains [Rhodococcus triatomae]